MRLLRISSLILGIAAVIFSAYHLVVHPIFAHFMYLKAVHEIESFGPSGVQYGSVGPNFTSGLVVSFAGAQDPSSKFKYLPYLTGSQPPPLPFMKPVAELPGFEQLLLIPGIQALSFEYAQYDHLDDRSLDILRQLPYLKSLQIVETRISDRALPAIASCLLLEDLSLDGSPLTSQGLEVLGGLKRLRTLSLWKTKVDDRFIDRLCSRKFLPRLQAIGVEDTQVTPAALERLKTLRPELEQHYLGAEF